MGGENELRLYARDPAHGAAAAQGAVAEIRRIEQAYSRYRDNSVVSRINRAAGEAPIEIDPETAVLLAFADDCYRASDGLFDITSGVLRRVWNFRGGTLPEAAAVSAILPMVGWNRVEHSGDTIRLPQSGMEIDFGGIGKEYAADRAAAKLMEFGIFHGLVNLGGDIRILGPHPDGSPWPIHIAHPRQPNAIVATIPLTTGALTTSGDYLRYIDCDGKRYCHILNPRTGWPVAHWQSATVIAPTCAVAGSLSTVSMLLEARSIAFLDARNAIYLLVGPQGELKFSPNLAVPRGDQANEK